MWTVLAPLIILVIVLLLGIRSVEKFTTTTPTTTSETLTRDASGNVVDASGNIVMAATTAPQSTISLSLMDLLRVITSTSQQATAAAVTASQQQQQAATPTAAKLYEEIKPELLADVRTTLRNELLQGSPFVPPMPVSVDGAGCSDAMAQGIEFTSAKGNLEDNSEYIRKDSIPCYGCTLAQ